MKHKNMTFSIPEDLRAVLYAHVGKMNLSKFISNAVRKSLEDETKRQEKELDAAYEAANQDSDRIQTIREWDQLDDVSDLIDEGEDWGWLKNKGKP
jgi:hypothetical protein